MKRLTPVIGSIMAAGLALAAIPAPAQEQEQEQEQFQDQNCMAPAALKQYLDRAFSEGRVASGWLDNGNRVELFATGGGTGTWTLIEFREDGSGCITAHGTGLRVERINLPLRPDFNY
tara:strand:- start:144 stop:497 length:354 start_codon:yes stop_codon:yes gene_type:complete